MKGKRFVRNWICLIIILLISAYTCKEKINAKPQQHVYNIENISGADSAIKYLSEDEKILQLYIFDSRNSELVSNKKIPSGILFGKSSIKDLQTDIQHLTKESKVPMLNIYDANYAMFDLPNYMNPLTVLSSRCNLEIVKNFAQSLADTLQKVGINAVTGFFSDFELKDNDFDTCKLSKQLEICALATTEFENSNIFTIIQGNFQPEYDSINKSLIDKSLHQLFELGARIDMINSDYKNRKKYNGLSITRILKAEEIKSAILSDNELIIGELKPEIFLSTVKILIKKDKKLKSKINDKISKILRIKYWRTSQTPFIEDRFEPEYASALAASKSITCIKNDSRFLPISDISNVRIIQIGGKRLSGFLSRCASYCHPEYYWVPIKYDEIKRAIPKDSKCNIIFLINSNLKDRKIISLINSVAGSKHACVVNFNNTENYEFLHGKSEIQVFGNDYVSSDYAAQSVFGGLYVCGEFPNKFVHNIKKINSLTIKPTRFQYCTNQEAGFNKNYNDTIDSIVNYAIQNNCFPGCQIFASVDGKVLINKGFGHLTYDTITRKVSTNDIYDIASLTKICAATILSIYLTSEKKINPNTKLGKYFSEPINWSNLPADTIVKGKDTTLIRKNIPTTTVYDVSIKSILEHKSGIEPYVPIGKFIYSKSAAKRCAKALNINPDTMSDKDLETIMFNEYYCNHFAKDTAEVRVCEDVWLKNNYADTLHDYILRLKVSDKKTYKYSDVNMILLQMAAENILKCKADEFLEMHFYEPLGMRNTTYQPYKHFCNSRIAPTEADYWTQKYRCGDVHDPSAALLGGVSGNAGLFSTAQNIGTLMQMLLNYGCYGGKRYLDSLTISEFTKKQPGTGRALGFDMVPSNFAANTASATTYGHTGFTGTCAWVDPEKKIVIVFLSNRVYPTANNKNINTLKIRRKICQAIYDGLDK